MNTIIEYLSIKFKDVIKTLIIPGHGSLKNVFQRQLDLFWLFDVSPFTPGGWDLRKSPGIKTSPVDIEKPFFEYS